MRTEINFLESPLKHAFIAALIFAGSAFLLGYLYEFLALSAFDLLDTKSSWPGIRDIPGLSLSRVLRYFVFYFFTLTILICYIRSSAQFFPWGPIILLVIIPLTAGIIPHLFINGEFKSSPHWSLLALLISLMLLNIGPKSSESIQRKFFIGLIITIALLSFVNEMFAWINETSAMADKIYGKQYAVNMELRSILYFLPAAALSTAIEIYLIYKIPLNFLKEIRATHETPLEGDI